MLLIVGSRSGPPKRSRETGFTGLRDDSQASTELRGFCFLEAWASSGSKKPSVQIYLQKPRELLTG